MAVLTDEGPSVGHIGIHNFNIPSLRELACSFDMIRDHVYKVTTSRKTRINCRSLRITSHANCMHTPSGGSLVD